MPLNNFQESTRSAVTSTFPQNKFGSFSSFQSFNTRSETSDVDALLDLARSTGGAVAQAAEELVHPTTSILSTIGEGFKKGFKEFVDIISVPSQVVAGVISKDYTVSDAIKMDISPSDVLFGTPDKSATTMEKVGGFLVRTATDILLDPLTYVTFGAGQGIFGLRGTSKITLGSEAAKSVGVVETATKALSSEGQDVYKFLKQVERQQNGVLTATSIRNGDPIYGFAENELKQILSKTIDAPLNVDFAKKALSNVLEKNPALAETLLDKGGIKLFGKSILSGQRVSSVMKMIPGMTFIDNLTKQPRMAIQALFDPAVVKVNGQYTRLPEEFVELERAGRELAQSLGDERLVKLSDIVRANKLTATEADILRSAVEANKIPADARLANAYKQLTGFNNEDFKFLRDSGIPVSYLDNHVPHVLVKENVQEIPFKLPPKQKVEAAMERKIKGTIDEIQAAGFDGFDTNLVTAHAKRTLDNVSAGVSRQFMRSVAENFGMLASEAPKGYTKIGLKGIQEEGEKFARMVLGKEGEELVFHPAVAKRVEDFIGAVINDEPTKDLLKAFDKVQNLWKASVTSIFPAFHGRNAISNVFLHFMDLGVHSLNPAIHATSVDLLSKNIQYGRLARKALEDGTEVTKEMTDLLSKKVFTDSTGYDWTFGELQRVIKEKGVAFNRRVTGAIDVRESKEEFMKSLFPMSESKTKRIAKKALPVSQEFLPFKAGREVGSFVEEQARLVDFVANLKKTGDVNLAAQRTKQFLFDYTYLTNFEKTFLRRLIPFYTFTRKNIELQVKSLLSTPGRVAAEFTAITTLGDVLSGAKLNEEDSKNIPDWLSDGMSILKDKRGSTVEILAGLGTPVEQPFQAFQPNQLLGSISPLLRIPLEQATGYSFFQGKALSDVTNAAAFKNAPTIIKDYIGFTHIEGTKDDGTKFDWYTSLQPERMNILLNLPPTSRILSAMKQLQTADVSDQSKIMQFLTGVKPYSIDLDREAKNKEIELRRKLEKLLTDAKVTAQFTRVFVPKDKRYEIQQ